MKVKLTNIIIKSAEAGTRKQRSDGSFKPGTNGPWHHKDTPVRVTSHWAITFSYAYRITKNKKYKEAALKAGKFLLSSKCRPRGYSFYCRKNKSRNNGLIGQAWAIEGLVTLYEAFGYKPFLDVAEDVLLKHKFNRTLGLWKELGVSGRTGKLKRTINQHLMFLYVTLKVVKITGNKILKEKSGIALEKLPENIEFGGEHILHGIHNNFKNSWLKSGFRKVSKLGIPLVLPKSRKITRGYLSFVLFVLALLKRENPDLPFWVHYETQIAKTLQFVQKHLINQKANSQNFSWSYNPTGFETALAIETFRGTKGNWVGLQLGRHFDFTTNLMDKNTCDPETLASRIYEATYLKSLTLDLQRTV